MGIPLSIAEVASFRRNLCGWTLGAALFFCRGGLLSLAVVGAPVRVLLLWDGKGSAVHVAMQRAAMADAARFVGYCTAVHFLPCLGA